jgi:Flp pilus assembly protein TadB
MNPKLTFFGLKIYRFIGNGALVAGLFITSVSFYSLMVKESVAAFLLFVNGCVLLFVWFEVTKDCRRLQEELERRSRN